MHLAETGEIAGNIVDTSFGNGIITYGGKNSGSYNVVPLTRMLVHHNQIDNTMLGCNDYGGLEHFQGGPVYLYDNITRNSVGNRTLGTGAGLQPLSRRRIQMLLLQQHHRRQGEEPTSRTTTTTAATSWSSGSWTSSSTTPSTISTMAWTAVRATARNILGNLMVDCKKSFIGQNRAG